MTCLEFNQLSENDQVEIIIHEGEFASLKSNGVQIKSLYLIKDFFVEVEFEGSTSLRYPFKITTNVNLAEWVY